MYRIHINIKVNQQSIFTVYFFNTLYINLHVHIYSIWRHSLTLIEGLIYSQSNHDIITNVSFILSNTYQDTNVERAS